MKLFLFTVTPAEVVWAAAHGLLDGVVTSPALLAELGVTDARAHIADLARLVPGALHAAVQSMDGDDAVRDGRELAKLADQVVVQIPLVEETLGAMHRLRADGVRVAATQVYNAAQALLAARAGASSVVVALGPLRDAGVDGLATIRSIRAAFDGAREECDVLALHPASANEFGLCAAAGADAVAITPELCRSLLVHPLTDRGVDQFLGDAARLRRAWPVL